MNRRAGSDSASSDARTMTASASARLALLSDSCCSSRIFIKPMLAVVAIALGQLGLWLYAGTEGGVLPPLDYLGQVFGPLVPAEFTAAAIFAWVRVR